jgi:hypothetical protein
MRPLLLVVVLAFAAWLTLSRPDRPPMTPEPGLAGAPMGEEGPPWAAPLTGRMVDTRTGEPLGELRLELGESTLFTDAQGWFRTAELLPAGEVTLEVGDGRPTTRRVRLQHAREVYAHGVPERKLASGPTYRLRSNEPLAGRRVRLISLADPDLPSAVAVVRAGREHDWTRFAPLPEPLASRGPWGLVVEDPRRVIEGDITDVVGADRPPVPLRITARARLHVAVSDSDGHVALGARLGLRPLEIPPASSPPLSRAMHDGELRLDGLRAGSYAMTVACPGYYEQSTTLDLGPGTLTELPLVLEPVLGDGQVEVVLESATGEYHGTTSVLLTPIALAETGLHWEPKSRRVAWAEIDGRWVGTCSFEGLPAGRYEVSPHGGRFHCWAPASLRTDADADPVGLRLLDRGDESDLLLRVFDADSGAWLDEYSLELTGRGCGRHFSFARSVEQDRLTRDEPALAGVPPAVEVRWCVSHEGYRRYCGELEEFTAPALLDGRRVRIANVHLQPEQ